MSVLETAATWPGFPLLFPSMSIALLASDSVLDSNELARIFRLSFFRVSLVVCDVGVPFMPFLLLVFGVAMFGESMKLLLFIIGEFWNDEWCKPLLRSKLTCSFFSTVTTP